MTVVTRVRLDEGTEPAWDAAMRERMATAETAEGWVSGQILMPLEALDQRVIVGVWETRAHWEAWHEDPVFRQTRDRLAEIGAGEGETVWHEVLYQAEAG